MLYFDGLIEAHELDLVRRGESHRLASSAHVRDVGPEVTVVTVARESPVLRSLEMDAAVWTAIGLVAATSLGMLFYVGGRIDALGGRIDSLGARLDGRIDGLAGRFDSLSGRFDSLEARIDSRFDNLEARLDQHLERHAG